MIGRSCVATAPSSGPSCSCPRRRSRAVESPTRSAGRTSRSSAASERARAPRRGSSGGRRIPSKARPARAAPLQMLRAPGTVLAAFADGQVESACDCHGTSVASRLLERSADAEAALGSGTREIAGRPPDARRDEGAAPKAVAAWQSPRRVRRRGRVPTMSLIPCLVAYAGIAAFGVAVIARARVFARVPVHPRREQLPVPHQARRAARGCSSRGSCRGPLS